jgi:hypothetical protein
MKHMSQRLNRLTIGSSRAASPPQGIRFARGMASVAPTFKRRLYARFSARL